MTVRRWVPVLAILATATALSLAILAGWQRGGTLPERLIWIAIGTVLVTSAHLLPALIREMPILIRGVGSLLWGACLATACYGHAVFFTFAMQHAGELRASTVQVTAAPSSARSLTTVMAERAAVIAQLAGVNARYCVGNCSTLEGRRATLAAGVDALNAEADDIRRQQAATDRVAAQRDALLVDPITARLAVFLGTSPARIDLLSGLLFSAVLEGVACLLWTVSLRSSLPAPRTVMAGETTPVVMASHANETVSRHDVTPSHDSTGGSCTPRDDPVTPLPVANPFDDHLPQLVQDIAAGRVRPTVADIRRHLGCSQVRAAALRRQLAARNVTA